MTFDSIYLRLPSNLVFVTYPFLMRSLTICPAFHSLILRNCAIYSFDMKQSRPLLVKLSISMSSIFSFQSRSSASHISMGNHIPLMILSPSIPYCID